MSIKYIVWMSRGFNSCVFVLVDIKTEHSFFFVGRETEHSLKIIFVNIIIR